MDNEESDKFLSSSPVGKRFELAPHLDRWMAGDRYGRVVAADGCSGVALLYKVKMDKSGHTMSLADTNFRVL